MGGRKRPKDDFLSRVRPIVRAATSPRKVLQRLVQEHAKTSEAARRLQAMEKASGVEALAEEARRLGLIDGAPDDWESKLISAGKYSADVSELAKELEDTPTYKIRDPGRWKGYIPTDMIQRWRWCYLTPEDFTSYVHATWNTWDPESKRVFEGEGFGTPDDLPDTANRTLQTNAVLEEMELVLEGVVRALLIYWSTRLPGTRLIIMSELVIPDRLLNSVMDKDLKLPAWLDRQRFTLEQKPPIFDDDCVVLDMVYDPLHPTLSRRPRVRHKINKRAILSASSAAEQRRKPEFRQTILEKEPPAEDAPTEDLSPNQFASLFQEWMEGDADG